MHHLVMPGQEQEDNHFSVPGEAEKSNSQRAKCEIIIAKTEIYHLLAPEVMENGVHRRHSGTLDNCTGPWVIMFWVSLP